MKESTLVRKIEKFVSQKYQGRAWLRRLCDRYTRGLPDLLMIWRNNRELCVLFIECKRPKGKRRAIQETEARIINALTAPFGDMGGIPCNIPLGRIAWAFVETLESFQSAVSSMES
jgi:hypothetical protein